MNSFNGIDIESGGKIRLRLGECQREGRTAKENEPGRSEEVPIQGAKNDFRMAHGTGINQRDSTDLPR